MAKTFTSILRFLAPRWLTTGDGGKVLQALTTVVDDHLDRSRQGLEARFPTYAARDARDDALALIGKDRGIPRGRAEVAAHYAQRLIGWRYPRGHRVRGSAFALLNQVSEYFGGIDCWTIDVNSNRHERTAAGVESFSYAYPWPWDTDSRLWRFWVVIVPGALMRAQPALGDPTLWGGTLGTPGYSIGQLGAVPDDADAMRELFTSDCPWKPDNALPMWLVVNLDGTTHTPDPTWAHWSKNVAGTQVASRYAGWRYWSLFAGNNTYTGSRANPASTVTLVGGGTYTGTRIGTPPSTITLPSGAAYTGTRAGTPPSTITLLDDGDAPA